MRAAAREMMPPRLHGADEVLRRRTPPDVARTLARSRAISPSNTSTRLLSRCHGAPVLLWLSCSHHALWLATVYAARPSQRATHRTQSPHISLPLSLSPSLAHTRPPLALRKPASHDHSPAASPHLAAHLVSNLSLPSAALIAARFRHPPRSSVEPQPHHTVVVVLP